MRAWRSPKSGAVQLSKTTVPDAEPLALPCGSCIGCITNRAREWTLRAQLELKDHKTAVMATLTYDDKHCPPTLSKRHYQLFTKKLRRAAEPLRLRHFSCGEYGETGGRPHYHAIIYGLDQQQGSKLVDKAWQQGFTEVSEVTPARIAYVAGYVTKKIAFRERREERVDPETGELYTYEPPFLMMSKRPGIGGTARQHTASWKTHAVLDGVPMKTPRFYHEAWKKTATAEMLEQLEYERQQNKLTKSPITLAQQAASEQIAKAKAAETRRRRKL